jgi:integrase/recombinase XerD
MAARQKSAERTEHDPRSWRGQLAGFAQWLLVHHYSERTIENRQLVLGYFIDWAEERGLTRPQEVTRPILERYQRWLYLYRKDDGEPLSIRGQRGRLSALRAWFKWMTQQRQLLYNPAADLELPRQEKRLPRHILTAAEADQVLNVPDTETALGIRDRAILETLYSTGMRRMELIGLDIHCIDVERGTVMIRQGKGRKDRMIPIGERALAWIAKYRDQVRPDLVLGHDDGALFLTAQGEAFTPNRLTQLVRRQIDAAGIGKRGSCHLFRHTMATLMLENGADVRFIQAMLGHAELSTTQIYTQVSIKMLKEIHTRTHPARLERRQSAVVMDVQEDAQGSEDALEDAQRDLWEALDEEQREESNETPGACS